MKLIYKTIDLVAIISLSYIISNLFIYVNINNNKPTTPRKVETRTERYMKIIN